MAESEQPKAPGSRIQEQISALQCADAFPADGKRAQTWYEMTTNSKLLEFREGTFSKEFLKRLPEWSAQYSGSFDLIAPARMVEVDFKIKPFNSVVDKLYRQAILNRENFVFSDCFSSMEDIFRVTLTSPYGDGVMFLAKKLKDLGNELNAKPLVKERADEYGYYAIHFTFEIPVSVLSYEDFQVKKVDIRGEIQLTTLLQSSLRLLTHGLYEERRLQTNQASEWKWDFEHPQFRPSYIGHSLHLLESLLVDIKNVHTQSGGHRS